MSRRKRGLVVVLTLAVTIFATASAAFADITPPPGSSFTNKSENCNGIIPTPGSENTVKTLTGGSLVPGGNAQYTITFPTDTNNVGNWAIADCVLIGSGADLKTYDVLDQGEFHLVNNAEAFSLTFHVDIPADALVGTRICNVAKTTESPSKSPGSNRKAGPACFTIGGDVRIEKHSAADPTGALINGATFKIWNCVNSADDPTLQPIVVTPAPSSGDIYSSTLAGGAVVVATGGFVAVSGPSGSTCNVTETVPPPGYQLPDVVTHSFTIPVGTSGATIINFIDPLAPGSITIEKTAPASQQLVVFHFTITCTNPTNVYHVQVTGSGSVTQSDVPAGSSCTVTEDDPGSTFNPPVIDPSDAFIVTSNETVTVTVTNSLAPGRITIEKTAPASQQLVVFHFTITCTNPTNVYHVQVTGSGSVTQSDVPAGSSCTVTEDDPGSTFNPPVIDPSDAFTVGANQTVTVTVTNSLAPGSVTIEKTAPASEQNTVFTFDITCTNPTNVYHVQVTGTDSVTQTGIPAGSSCQVTETNVPDRFNPPVITPSGTFIVDANTGVTVTVSNTLQPGSVTIEKTAPASQQSAVFHFTITCTNPTNVYHVQVTGTGSVTQSGIPADSSCTVTEDDPGSTFEPAVITPSGAFTVNATETVTVTVANTLRPGAVTIVKVAPASQQSQVFHFSLDCTNPTQHYDLHVTGSHSVTQNNIPAGSSCKVTETSLPAVNAAPTINPSGEFTVGAAQSVTVTVTNTLIPVVLGVTILPKTGSDGFRSTGLVGLLFIAVGVVMATRKERGRVRPAFATSSSVAGRGVMLAANRRSWRMRRRRGPTTRARLRWRRSQGPPMRDGP